MNRSSPIQLKYPLLMVHGVGFRDQSLGISYWGRIPRCLTMAGVKPYYGGTDAWGSIESNAEQLRGTVLSVLAETGAEKVNIIAHSRGGLEARYLICALDMAPYVASLTTMSTPHSGVRAMNLALRYPEWMYRLVSFFLDRWFGILGDREPDFYRGSLQLSAIRCAEFNRLYPDRDGIYYQSYATKLRYFFSDMNYVLTWILVSLYDGDNDGLCPVESAKWGHFRGVITSEGILGVSHGGILDLYRIPYRGLIIPPSGTLGEDAPPGRFGGIPELYVSIVRDLAARGY